MKNALRFLAIFALLTVVFVGVEYYAYMHQEVKTVWFATYAVAVGFLFAAYVFVPLYKLMSMSEYLTLREAAREIGQKVPTIQDKLVNLYDLLEQRSAAPGIQKPLLEAAITQKFQALPPLELSKLHPSKSMYRMAYWVLLSLCVHAAVYFSLPHFYTHGLKRFIDFNITYYPKPPFDFEYQQFSEKAFYNEPYTIRARTSMPLKTDAMYVYINGKRTALEKTDDGSYQLTLSKVQDNLHLRLEADGYIDDPRDVQMVYRPALENFSITLRYPNYLNKADETILNNGNLILPEGTKVAWEWTTSECEGVYMQFLPDSAFKPTTRMPGQKFSYKKVITRPTQYSIQLLNQHGTNKDPLLYFIQTIEDQYPKIALEQFRDTNLFSYILVAGAIADDYGFTDLKLHYHTDRNQEPKQINLPIKTSQNSQQFYYQWNLESINLQKGEKLYYHLAVRDNDGIHGPKTAKTAIMTFEYPTQKEAEKAVALSTAQAENQITNTAALAEKMKDEVKKLEQKLKTKRQFDWQDKKALEDLIDKHGKMQKQLEELQSKYEDLKNKKLKFEQQNERIAEKTKMLQQLVQEILDEETKKLYQELSKLLQEKNKELEIKDLLDKIKNKEQNIEKELDRALELFKQLKFDSKLTDINQKLKELAEKQEKLSEKTQNDKNATPEQLEKEQQELNEAFNELREDIQELKDINNELENKHNLEDTQNQEKDIQDSQEKSSESLAKKDKKSAAKQQKEAADKMRNMQQKIQQMQQDMESEALAENMSDLREILENLLKISFEQEEIMKEFRKVSQQDPRFLTLSQRQLKLKDDTKIIEDSLYALSKRVMQIQSFIRRELELMNTYMHESSLAIKARRADMATGKQQFAMTSINNLALLLSDVLQQMQEQMSEKQGKGSGKGSKNKKNKGGTSLSQLQRKLNQQIEELKKSGMTGKQLSEELSKLARQQEQLRNMLTEQEGSQGKSKDGSGQNPLDEIKKEMEKTEADLVNKRLTEEMLQRQQDILNRLLEHEKAQREKDWDEKREAETAKEKERKLPPELEKYLKEKEKQVEMIKTIPPGLNPYFKRKADAYFQQINP